MARFDVYKMAKGGGFRDVQTNLISGLNTRVVVPLLQRTEAPIPAQRLNPVLEVDNVEVIMATQFLAAVPETELKASVGNLDGARNEISAALDMLFSGF
ncbi:MAG: CcdB family protein [Candidatus Azotimanducaceae bacterium WSBS_2022_MAG_OTU7]